nr:MAG TPA_asm: hypothetical protein [Caudoviricetes sp.]
MSLILSPLLVMFTLSYNIMGEKSMEKFNGVNKNS